jgi:hypothetical protein
LVLTDELNRPVMVPVALRMVYCLLTLVPAATFAVTAAPPSVAVATLMRSAPTGETSTA